MVGVGGFEGENTLDDEKRTYELQPIQVQKDFVLQPLPEVGEVQEV